MLQRSVFSGVSLALAIFILCPCSLAQKAAPKKDSEDTAALTAAKRGESPAPTSAEEQLYKRTRAMLELFEKDLLDKQRTISQKLAGREAAGLGREPWIVTEKEVLEKFQGPIGELRRQLTDLEATHKQVQLEKEAPCKDCAHHYSEIVERGVQSYWRVDEQWMTLVVQILQQREERANAQQEEWRTKANDDIGNNPNLTSEAREAATAELDQKQSDAYRKIFDEIAREFRGYVLLLSADRKTLVEQLWCWHDLVGRLSAKRDDEFADTANRVKVELLGAWDTGTLSMGYGDGVVLPYENYDWCKRRPYPDIQDSSCHVLRIGLMKQPSVASLRPKNCPGAVPTLKTTTVHHEASGADPNAVW